MDDKDGEISKPELTGLQSPSGEVRNTFLEPTIEKVEKGLSAQNMSYQETGSNVSIPRKDLDKMAQMLPNNFTRTLADIPISPQMAQVLPQIT